MPEVDGKAGWVDRSRRVFPWITVALVAAGAIIRIAIAFASPVFGEHDPIGLLRSDPALLYYITERIIENGGWPPEDFRADPRIEHPEITDIPALETVGQEFLVAWAYLLFGQAFPLHLFALVFMSVIASTAVIGIVGLARELTASRGWACLAGLVYVVTAGSYRTIGFILIREDLSMPLFTLHLYLLARALRVGSAGSMAAAALSAVAALSTWHAMNFVVTIEAACIFAWFLRTGENPMAAGGSWVFLAVVAAGGLLVPVLASKLFLLSLPVQMLGVMAVMPLLRRRLGNGGLHRVVVALLCLVALALVSAEAKAWLAPGSGDYAHVVEMMLGKARYLGALPPDPHELSFGARLLWAGVFDTSSPWLLMLWLGALTFLTPVSTFASVDPWWRGRGDGRELTLVAFGTAALILALLVERLFALVAVLSPPLAVILLRSSFAGRARRPWVAALLLVQCSLASGVLDRTMLRGWYVPGLMRQLAGALHYIQDELAGEDAIAADYVTSSAVLAQTAHRSVLQPKYETTRSRDRIERFTTSLYHASPAEFREILRRDFDARYLLIDAPFLWARRYEAGVRLDARAPPSGSAAFSLLTNDRSLYGTLPGYRLLYESAPRSPRFRLYELVGDEARSSDRNP